MSCRKLISPHNIDFKLAGSGNLPTRLAFGAGDVINPARPAAAGGREGCLPLGPWWWIPNSWGSVPQWMLEISSISWFTEWKPALSTDEAEKYLWRDNVTERMAGMYKERTADVGQYTKGHSADANQQVRQHVWRTCLGDFSCRDLQCISSMYSRDAACPVPPALCGFLHFYTNLC